MNIRRGNTFLLNNWGDVKCVRRGPRKFFDLNKDFMDINLKTKEESCLSGGFKDKDELLAHKGIIFNEVQAFLQKEEGTVTVYNSNKANGEN